MKKLFTLTLAVLGFITFSCDQQNNEPASDSVQNTDTTIQDHVVHDTAKVHPAEATNPCVIPDTSLIAYFSEFPKEIDGCSQIYSGCKDSLEKHRYIYMSNFDSLAFMKINGAITKFKLIKTETLDSKSRTYHFTAGEYQLIVRESDGERLGDELWENSGTLTLIRSGGKTEIIQFVGESGC